MAKSIPKGLCQCGCGRRTNVCPMTNNKCGRTKGQPVNYIHGHNRVSGRFATRKDPEYIAYANAKQRATNSKRKGYYLWGGRGIRFRFKNFQEFFKELGKRPSPAHTVDRINNNGHYEPGNVRWATWEQQHKNKRVKGAS